MLRSGPSQLLSLALLLLAGSFEPAWELGHAVLHLEAGPGHHSAESAPPTPDPTAASVSASDDQLGHEHPVFQSPVRLRGDFILAMAALPAGVVEPRLETLTVRSLVHPGAPARASPLFRITAQPRAPPLV